MFTTNPTTRRRRRIGTLAASGVAVLALGLGACSGGGDDSATGTSSSATSSPATELTAFQAVKASAETSKQAGSAKFSFTMGGTAEGQALDMTGDGAFDASTGAFEMSMTLPAEAGGMAITMRMVDGVMYLSGAPMTAEGQWVQMPLDAMGAGLDTSSMDPATQLDKLQAVADDVTETGTETIRGVEATGYSGTIDAVKALELAPAEQQTEDAKAAAAQLGSIPFTLYVDSENRPVRITQSLDVEGSAMDISMDFYDWGSDVSVAAPDPATVTDMSSMMGGLESETAGA
jgi:hypothetical protein